MLLGKTTALMAVDAALTSFGTAAAKFGFSDSGTGKAGNVTVAVLSLLITHFLKWLPALPLQRASPGGRV